jgi:outer membrane protein assembly factor BamB
MTIRTCSAAAAASLVLLLIAEAIRVEPARAQPAGGRTVTMADWPTFAHDSQRTGWAFEETRIAPDSISQMKLVWKTKLNSDPYSIYNLTPPLIAGGISTVKGLRNVLYTVGVTGSVYAVDAETGEELWERKLTARVTPVNGGFQGGMLCPNGPTGSPVIDKGSNSLFVIGSNGQLYGLDLGSGEIHYGPVQFVAPFSKDSHLTFADGVVYTSLAQGCGEGTSGIYSIDVRDRRNPVIRQGLTSGGTEGGPWGHGTALGTNGRIYGGTADGNFDPQNGVYSNAVVAFATGTMKLADYFLPVNWRSLRARDLDLGSAAPVFFGWKNRNLVAHGAKEAVINLMDADNLGGADHQTPLYSSPRLGNDEGACCTGLGIWGGLSVTRDNDGNTFLLAPLGGPPAKDGPKYLFTNGAVTHGAVLALRLVADAKTGNPALQPEWVSRDLDMPDGVVSANGVVFALATGSNEVQRGGDKVRMSTEHPAVLYAFDLKNGKELWNSGAAIESWMHFSGLAVSNGNVYVVDHAGNVYDFGGLPAPVRRRGGRGASGAGRGAAGRGAQ